MNRQILIGEKRDDSSKNNCELTIFLIQKRHALFAPVVNKFGQYNFKIVLLYKDM